MQSLDDTLLIPSVRSSSFILFTCDTSWAYAVELDVSVSVARSNAILCIKLFLIMFLLLLFEFEGGGDTHESAKAAYYNSRTSRKEPYAKQISGHRPANYY